MRSSICCCLLEPLDGAAGLMYCLLQTALKHAEYATRKQGYKALIQKTVNQTNATLAAWHVVLAD